MTVKKNKILIIKHGALGDMIFAQGAFQAICAHHKNDHVVLLTTSPYASLLEKMDLFDEIWIDDRPRPLVQLRACIQLFKKLFKGRFDYVYDLQKSKRTRLYFKVMKWFFKPMPKWCSKFEGCHFSYSDPGQKNLHIYDRHANLLSVAGINRVPVPDVSWMKADVSRFSLPEKYFLFVPGCSPTQLHKRWAPASYGSIAKILIAQGISPVLIGRDEEKDVLSAIQECCPQSINLINQTSLFDLAELGRHAVGALGHDTGPMHIVAVTHCPSILLFSYSSIPEHYAPRGFQAQVIHSHSLDDVSVEEVLEKIKPMLSQQ